MSFQPILMGLSKDHPAIRGVIFCDDEGERVEAFIADPSLDDYDLDLAGASYATLMPYLTSEDRRMRLRISSDGGLIWIQQLTKFYFLLVITRHAPRDGLLGPYLETVADAIVMQM